MSGIVRMGVLFIRSRLYFHHIDGARALANSGAPSALVAYGKENVAALRRSGICGALITEWDWRIDISLR